MRTTPSRREFDRETVSFVEFLVQPAPGVHRRVSHAEFLNLLEEEEALAVGERMERLNTQESVGIVG
jgi:hypothetical protein